MVGLRVIDLTRVLGGPIAPRCSPTTAPTSSRSSRRPATRCGNWGPPFHDGDAAYFIGINRNKRSIGLDLASPGGREVLMKLLEGADVLIENFKPGTLDKWGIGNDVLSAHFPRLIHCRISGFGGDGPRGGNPGYDAIIQAMTGMIAATGSPESGPMRIGVPLVDIATGLYAAIGILMALAERQHSGQGQFLETTLYETGLAIMHPHAANYFLHGNPPRSPATNTRISSPMRSSRPATARSSLASATTAPSASCARRSASRSSAPTRALPATATASPTAPRCAPNSKPYSVSTTAEPLVRPAARLPGCPPARCNPSTRRCTAPRGASRRRDREGLVQGRGLADPILALEGVSLRRTPPKFSEDVTEVLTVFGYGENDIAALMAQAPSSPPSRTQAIAGKRVAGVGAVRQPRGAGDQSTEGQGALAGGFGATVKCAHCSLWRTQDVVTSKYYPVARTSLGAGCCASRRWWRPSRPVCSRSSTRPGRESGAKVALVIGNSAYQNVAHPAQSGQRCAGYRRHAAKAGFDVDRQIRRQQSRHAPDAPRFLRQGRRRRHRRRLLCRPRHRGRWHQLPAPGRPPSRRDIDVEDEAVSLDRILRIVDPAQAASSWSSSMPAATIRSPSTMNRAAVARALGRAAASAKVEPTSPNTLIAYAAKAGSTAADGTSDHSPFTDALLHASRPPRGWMYGKPSATSATTCSRPPTIARSRSSTARSAATTSFSRPSSAPPKGAQVTLAPPAAADPLAALRLDYELAAQVNTGAADGHHLSTIRCRFSSPHPARTGAKLDPAASRGATRPAPCR